MATVSSCLVTIVALITLSKFACDSTPCSQTRFTKTYIDDIDDEYSSLLMSVSDVSHFECSRAVSRDPLLLWFVYNTETRECAASERWDIPTTEVLNSNTVLYKKWRVNGQWSDWGSWSPPYCSGVCDTDATDITQTRSRSCTNPSPANGGTSCSGSSSETNNISCVVRPCPIHDYNLGDCLNDNDCSDANTVCVDGTCLCHMDFFYDNGSCVATCSTFGTTFASYYGKVVVLSNDRSLSSTFSECRQLCIDETEFICKTADFNFITNNCQMSASTWSSAETAKHSRYYELIRNCI